MAGSSVVESDDDQRLRDNIRAKFEQSIHDNRDLDDAGREFLLEHLRNAIETAPIQPTLIARPDRGQWVEMLEDLRAGGHAGDDDVAALIRKFDEAMHPLDSIELKVATEFAKRCEQDGQEQALEWLEAQRDAAEESRLATAAVPSRDARHQPEKPKLRKTRSPRGSPG